MVPTVKTPDTDVDVHTTDIPGLLVVEPRVFGDDRGFFLETWNRRRYAEAGLDVAFVQDNLSRSQRGTLRGLHYQIRMAQGKLVSVVRGEVFDVAVDLRRWSPTFGQWRGFRLSESNRRQVYVPPGCAHGFLVISESADFAYKCTDLYAPEHERAIRWDDPAIGIEWPIDVIRNGPMLSEKDANAIGLAEAECFEDEDELR